MKNKHAKGPDGQPLININSGRGRGRPKKNANGVRFSHVEPTSENFFKASSDRAGGTVEPSLGFKEVYTEIYIKRAKRELPPVNLPEDGELDENEEKKGDEDDIDEENERDQGPSTAANQSALSGLHQQNSSALSAAEKIKKKRGRKPKSFYLQQQQDQERAARE